MLMEMEEGCAGGELGILASWMDGGTKYLAFQGNNTCHHNNNNDDDDDGDI